MSDSAGAAIPRKGALLIYPRDEVADYRLLEGDEFKALYLLRLQSFMGWIAYPDLPAGHLPDDDQLLQRTSGLDAKRWGQVRRTVLSLLSAASGGYCCEKVVAAVKFQGQRKGAADARWNARRDAGTGAGRHAEPHAGSGASDATGHAGTDAEPHAGADTEPPAGNGAGRRARRGAGSDAGRHAAGHAKGHASYPNPNTTGGEEEPDAVESAAVAESSEDRPSRNSLENAPDSVLRVSHSSHSAPTGAREGARGDLGGGIRSVGAILSAKGGRE